jgi:glycosyltransferase involved in cell wall biosynthesis
MKSNGLVSIIMTCYNGKYFLKEAIQSILDQTYQNWELIFYDNCSDDGSGQLVSQYQDSRIRCFKSKKLVNLGTIRKLSLQKCQGSFVSFLDVDDYWSKFKLQKQIEKFESDSNLDIVYSNYYEVRREKVEKIFFFF